MHRAISLGTVARRPLGQLTLEWNRKVNTNAPSDYGIHAGVAGTGTGASGACFDFTSTRLVDGRSVVFTFRHDASALVSARHDSATADRSGSAGRASPLVAIS
jgi:hypothetical protein